MPVWIGLGFRTVLHGLARLTVICVRCRYSQRVAASRHSMWATITRELPDGSALVAIEPDGRTLVCVGRSMQAPRRSRGGR